MKRRERSRGFTLIELLVVIAIIGLLASVIIAALSSSRIKSRDTRRLADIRQLQNALELYYIANTNYPTPSSGALTALTTANSIPSLPLDPLGGGNYTYSALGSGTTCNSYHLGAYMELATTQGLANDIDASAGSPCNNGGSDFSGTSAGTGTGVSRACSTDTSSPAPSGGERCYDVKP